MTRTEECRKRVMVAAFAYGQALVRAGTDAPRNALDGPVRAYKKATNEFRDAMREERRMTKGGPQC